MGLFSRTAGTEVRALAERLAGRSVLLIDVRQPSEWRHGHIRSAQNLPLIQLKQRLSTLPRGKTIVTVCASGHRSAAAARMLERAGYDVENLEGGMRAWVRAGLPVEKR